MYKMSLTQFSDIPQYKHESLTPKNLSDHEVFIENEMVGFNPVDFKIGLGKNLISQKIQLPWTPGFEILGKVKALGKGVTEFQVGDRVCGMVGFPLTGGGYASHTVASVDDLVKIPLTIPAELALAGSLAGLTAIQAFLKIKDRRHSVLVFGGTGSVAFSLMNLFKTHDIYSYFTYRDQAGYRYLKQFSHIQAVPIKDVCFLCEQLVVIDLVGGESADLILRKNPSQIIQVITIPTFSFELIKSTCEELKIDFASLIVEPNKKLLSEVIESLATNHFKMPSIQKFPLSQVQQVMEEYAQGQIKGKIIFTI